MELREIMKLQYNFDKEHSGRFDWASHITGDNLEILEFLLISIVGEIGELANIIKKVARGDYPLDSLRDQIEDELADIFIYLIKICNQMKIDLESIFLEKLKKNRDRFVKYER